jgi:hypothetical protein
LSAAPAADQSATDQSTPPAAAPAAPPAANAPTAPAADHLAAIADLGPIDPHHHLFGEGAHHFHHMWG